MARILVRRYLTARAEIRRKNLATGAWGTIHDDVPCAVADTTTADGSPDPADAGTRRRQTYDVAFAAWQPPHPQVDQQLLVTVGGVALPAMTVLHVSAASVQLLVTASCAAEESAVERYRVTALRRDTATGVDEEVGPWDVRLTVDDNRIGASDGASAIVTSRVGTITGGADLGVEVGDVLVGLPAPLTACVVLDVMPVVLDQREATFTYSVGQGR